MNKLTISLTQVRNRHFFTLALPVGILLLTQACAPPPRRVELPKSAPIAVLKQAPSVTNQMP
jgi:hypothetical protein